MSRCVPFPPPGYMWNGVSGEALVELLKVRGEKAEAEKEREKRRRKKEKRKRKQDMNLEEGETRLEKRSHSGKNKHRRRKKGDKRSDKQGKRENETQALERSSVTEELEQPVSDSLYDSCDNSRNIKRQKHNWYPNGFNNHGSIVSMDFQLQKHKDPEVLSTTRTDLVVQEKFALAPRPIKEKFSSTYELHRSSSQRIEASTDEKAEMAMPSSFSESGLLQIEAQFKGLTIGWVPPPIQSELSEFGDQKWLFERTQPRRDITERSDASNDDLSCGSSTLYPRAQYLPQADVYALPYTIPY